METLTKKQWALLVPLTLAWGLNWPVMKLGVTDYPPITFRALSLWLGVPVLGATNMFVWHVCIIVALKELSSGRAAILGYTMPIFSALLGAWLFGTRLAGRAWLGVGAAALGVALLLWHAIAGLSGKPGYMALALFAAATWALGTQLLRRTRMPVPTLAISFWMTTLTAVVMAVLAVLLERPQWKAPSAPTWAAIVYNAVLIFGFAHAAWFALARELPPIASTLSVMLIPVLGVFSGALWLGEVLHWQDWAAVALMVVAIAAVLSPAASRTAAPAVGPGRS
ncbi:MAG: EamA family transporter [Proteobacteria bacterium]|nr:EamA family transporter [Pseudomonadota bacterium]